MHMRNFITGIILTFMLVSLYAQKSNTIPHSEGKTYYKTYGEGLPILIINGGPGMNSNGFASLAEILSRNYQAILYDQRGTGRSEMDNLSPETLTLDKMVGDIERIRKHLGYENWVVLGHSFGGMLASYYATLHPEKIKGLILSSSGGLDLQLFEALDISSRLSEEQRDSLQYWNRKIANGDTSYHARFQRGKHLAPAYLFDTTFINQVAHRLTQSNMTINGWIWQNMREMEFDCKMSLKEFHSPVLILQGEFDPVDLSIAKTAHSVFPNSRLIILSNCAHYGWLEAPDLYFSEIDQLMEKVVH